MPEHPFKDPIPNKKNTKENNKKITNPFCGFENSFMGSLEIQNIAQLRSYIKGQLGSPVICCEISDSQMNDVIRDMIQYIWRYYYREGNYRDYLMMELIPGKTHYKLCQELEAVVDFNTSNWLGTINELFTVPHNMLYDTMMSMNNFTFNGMCYGDSSYGDVMGNFHATLTWLEQVKMDLGEAYQVRYNTKEKELSVWPTPKHPVRGLMEVYKRQKVQKVINDFWFKELVVSRCGMLWTNSLRKYNMSIAGSSGSLNGDSLYSSYKERYDAAVERIDKESPNGDCFMVG